MLLCNRLARVGSLACAPPEPAPEWHAPHSTWVRRDPSQDPSNKSSFGAKKISRFFQQETKKLNLVAPDHILVLFQTPPPVPLHLELNAVSRLSSRASLGMVAPLLMSHLIILSLGA